MTLLKRFKWPIYWSFFAVLVSSCVLFVYLEETKDPAGESAHRELLVEMLGSFTGVYLSLLIFMKSKEHADQQNREYLEHVQHNNNLHIQAMMQATERQIEEYRRNAERQIAAILEASQLQVKAMRQAQGDTSYERAAHRRQLGYEISALKGELKLAEEELERRKIFVFLRTSEERKRELDEQNAVIRDLKQKLANCRRDLKDLEEND